MDIEGRVVFQELEGGFWGIEGDDGMQYKPVGELPEAVRVAGQRVRASVEPAPSFGIAMWGQEVQVKTIEAIT